MQRLGEVVEASNNSFVVHCYELYGAPVLGSLVQAGTNPTIFALVNKITTQGIDPTRRPVARGQDEENEDGVYSHNPQLEHLLRTDFEAIAIGFEVANSINYHLPPSPPHIHAFVYSSSKTDVQRFTSSLAFVEEMLASVENDAVITAFLHQASLGVQESHVFLVDACKELARILSGHLPRLQGLLRRLER